MSLRNALKTAATAAGLFGLLAAYTVAQQASRQLDRPQTQPSERSATRQIDRDQSGRVTTQYSQRDNQVRAGAPSQEVEHYLANCILIKNQAEIDIAEFAQQHAQNEQVKQFAQQMIQDHRQFAQKLQQLAGMQGATRPSSTGVENRQIDAQRNAADTTPLPGSPGAGVAVDARPNQSLTATTQAQGPNAALSQLIQIDRQITDRCVQGLKEELQQKTGAEFDKCYVGSQVGAHMQMLAALEVIGQQAQGPLAEVVQQAQPTVQKHLDHAKQLAMQFEGASRPGAQAERQQPSRTQR